MPTAITPGPPAGPATPAAGMRLSSRMPAIFRSPTRTSLGHFRRALSDAARASASATASALTSEYPPHRSGVPRGRTRMDVSRLVPGAASHARPRRPRPAA